VQFTVAEEGRQHPGVTPGVRPKSIPKEENITQEQANSNPVNDSPRCKHHTRVGRCRWLGPLASGAFCPKHGRLAQNRTAEDLSAELVDPHQGFPLPP